MKISKIFGWICLILWIIALVLDIVGCVGGVAAEWTTTIVAHVLILFFVARDLAYEYFLYPYLTINLGSIKRKEDNE
jgi:hypothetical protein